MLTIYNKYENGENRSRQHNVLVQARLNEDNLNQNAFIYSYDSKCLNIWHGYGVSVVVRGSNTDHMAKGDSYTTKIIKERCVRHYEKSKDYFGKPTETLERGKLQVWKTVQKPI